MRLSESKSSKNIIEAVMVNITQTQIFLEFIVNITHCTCSVLGCRSTRDQCANCNVRGMLQCWGNQFRELKMLLLAVIDNLPVYECSLAGFVGVQLQ